jgi:isoamylase
MLVALRRSHPIFTRPTFYTGEDTSRSTRADIEWLSADGRPLDWNTDASCFAVYIDGTELGVRGERLDDDFYILFNAGRDGQQFVVPAPPAGLTWYTVVDTALPAPMDVREDPREGSAEVADFREVAGRSLVVLRTGAVPHDRPVA